MVLSAKSRRVGVARRVGAMGRGGTAGASQR